MSFSLPSWCAAYKRSGRVIVLAHMRGPFASRYGTPRISSLSTPVYKASLVESVIARVTTGVAFHFLCRNS